MGRAGQHQPVLYYLSSLFFFCKGGFEEKTAGVAGKLFQGIFSREHVIWDPSIGVCTCTFFKGLKGSY